jgi:hypothetical protein
MQCEQVMACLTHERYEAGRSAELEAHLSGCPACATFAKRETELDAALSKLDPVAASAGFDARFYARLSTEKASGRRRAYTRVAWAALPLAAAAGVLLFLRPGASPARVETLPREEMGIAVELELVRNLDVVSRLDELQAYDMLNELDESDLARIAGEKL